MFGRIWRYIKTLFGMKLDDLEDPDVLLKQAQDEMREAQQKNRERAVQAITQKNELQALVDQTEKTIANLQAKAEMALRQGDEGLARQLLMEKSQYDTSLASTKESLQHAVDTTEQIKVAIRREEERIRLKTAQALSLKAQWKQSQIETSINKALDGFTSDGSDAAFARAQAKISTAKSEASARTELASGRLENRLASLDDAAASSAAEDEMQALKIKMGLAPAPVAAQPATTASAPIRPATPDEIDRQLQELEARVGTGGSAGGTTPAP